MALAGLDMPVLVSTVLDEADLTTVLLDNHLAVSTEGLESICSQSLDGFKVPTFSVLLWSNKFCEYLTENAF